MAFKPLIRPSGKAFTQRSKDLEAREREHLEMDELRALWAVLRSDPFWFGYFKAQYFWGCRCSEVALIQKEDVAFEVGRVFIRRIKKPKVDEDTVLDDEDEDATEDELKNGYRIREYIMPPKIADVMRGVAPTVPPENPWFFGSKVRLQDDDDGKRSEDTAKLRLGGNGWRSVSRSTAFKHFAAAATEADIPKNLRHTHVLRHTRATMLFADGAAESEVQRLLDHSDPKITRDYIGWAKKMKTRADVASMLGDDE